MVSCIACRIALASDPQHQRCEQVYAIESGSLACEQCGASDLGPVSDDEVLNFLVCDPPFEDGTLTPGGLVQIDRSGLSVLRDAASDDEFRKTYRQLSEGKPRNLVAIARFTASTVRYDGDQRLVGVYDTPLDGKPNHCDILGPHIPVVPDVTSKTKAETLRKKRIKKLIEKIGPAALVPTEDFRGGFLFHLPSETEHSFAS